jgi:hypothetical protein
MKVKLVESGPDPFVGGGETFEPGDVKEVNDYLGEHLLAKPYFVEPDVAGADADDGGEFDVDEWLDQNYQTRAERVESGDVDEHLDEIAEAESSDNVMDAVGVRRAELEE